jgi:murein DD-endopeptidase MepM/ murein hydrolase activator NlpD
MPKVISRVPPFTVLLNAALAAVLLVVATPAPSRAEGEQAKLAATKAQLASSRKRLAEAKGRASALQQEIGKLDTQLADLDHQISSGQHDITLLESGIRTAQAQIGELQDRYDKAVQASSQRARRLYMNGPAQNFAMLFSMDSIRELARLQFWWEKSSEADSKTMIDAARLKADVIDRQLSLNHIKTDLNAQKDWLQQRKSLADQAKSERNKALVSVQKEIAAEQDHMAGLEADSARLTDVLSRLSSNSREGGSAGSVSRGGFMRPVPGRVTSPFGRRWGRMHTGVDLDGRTGDPIRAAKAGTILGIPCGSGYGNCTIIDHGGGVTTLYAHMSRKALSGGHVNQGQVIGYIGCTGHCTGSHLHFEVRINGVPRNPMGFI